ncbi:MAG: hypothetical protein L0Y61_01000 [Epsilonproteobacteria bacterium]|nr:hypothetical protein [Campylobacterota bacterium]
MTYPQFFDNIEKIILQDDLAKTLGTFEDGIVEFSFLDVVKSAGHSCPTVAGAYLCTLIGLKALYPNSIPKRGEIQVELPGDITEGVTGVIGTVMANITGATTNYGFKGLSGKFARTNLMFYNAPIAGDVRFTRTDTKESVEVIYNPSLIRSTKTIWQERVQEIFENIDKVITINK